MSVLIIKNGDIYAPEARHKKDILIINDKIVLINRDISNSLLDGIDQNSKMIDASQCMIIPGYIDQHVHINGAGGEGGPQFRTSPVQLSEFVKAGITSVVGLLGTDGTARSLPALLMKARALEQEGISTWIYTGAYQYPSPTITKSVLSDIMLIDKVIGVKIALSDHRASHPTLEEFLKVSSEARTGGILAGKAGIVHIHMGSEQTGLSYLFDLIKNTDIPIEQFAPTHLARDETSLKNDIKFGKMGGYIDITTGAVGEHESTDKIKPSKAVKQLMENGVSMERITMSTDGNGSIPQWNEKKELTGMTVASVLSLHREFTDMIQEEHLAVEEAVRVTSTNIASHLKLEQKGEIKEGKDADLLILDKNSLRIVYVVARGQIVMEAGKVMKFGTFERA